MHHTFKNLGHYLSIIGIVALGFWGIVGFSYDPSFQAVVVVAMGIAFVVWGVIHHWLHVGLSFKIVLEYAAVALLGVLVLLSIIWSK